MSLARCSAAAVVAGLVLVLGSAAPAAAHGGRGGGATNFVTEITGVTPALRGVRVKVIEAGDRLELRNDSATDVIVTGYAGEAYLRVGPGGVFENTSSPTTFLNRTRDGQAETGGDAAAAPVWRRTSAAATARWFDHRTHWTGAELPAEVKTAPGRPHLIHSGWKVPLTQGDTTSAVTGDLRWQPGPSPAPWLVLASAVGLATAALSLSRRWGPVLAVVTLALLGADLVHTFATAFAGSGRVGQHLLDVVTGSSYASVGWVFAVMAVRLLRRQNTDGLYAAVFAGLSMALFGGLLDLTSLSRSVVPLALPLWVGRLCVALALGLGVGLALAAVVLIRRTPNEGGALSSGAGMPEPSSPLRPA